jgi:septal ring factor EnvC (AmiA/AmiB activator)
VAKAREETALTLRGQAQTFLDLSNQVNKVNHEASRLERDLSRFESDLTSFENLLAQPEPPMLPLQIHRNEVKIRPVTVKIVE